MSSTGTGPQSPRFPGPTELAGVMAQGVKFANSRTGVAYRACGPEHAGPAKLLSGLGAAMRGGHWSPRGIAAAYTSLDPRTAMDEVLAHSAYHNYPVEEAFPLAFVSFRFDLQVILDLTSEQVQDLLQDFQDRIIAEDWRAIQRAGGKSVTQLIGQHAHEAGLEGLIVPSFARPGSNNVVIFPDNRRAGSRWGILNIDKLSGLP